MSTQHSRQRRAAVAEAQPALDLALPVARIRGEPMTEMPADLYIPPEALSVFLDAFEGPLDLLLYLIRKHSLDILDIPMAELTRQYMEYVEMMRTTQLELAAEYLLMAALLIEIKSRMLLPRPKREDEAEPEDPRAELVRRLLEYEQMKKARAGAGRGAGGRARLLAWSRCTIEQALAERLPGVARRGPVGGLALDPRAREDDPAPPITREQLSVRSHMSRILRRRSAAARSPSSRSSSSPSTACRCWW